MNQRVRRLLRTFAWLMSVTLCFAFTVTAQEMAEHHHLDMNLGANAESETVQDWAKQQLAKSPRHREWVKVKNGNREVNCFIVYPEVNKKATAVVVIHEIFGMSDWVQQMTDELAEAG